MLLLRKALGGKQGRQLCICTILKLERLPYGMGKASTAFVFIRNHSASIINTRPFLCSLNRFIFSTLMHHISFGCRNLPQSRRKIKGPCRWAQLHFWCLGAAQSHSPSLPYFLMHTSFSLGKSQLPQSRYHGSDTILGPPPPCQRRNEDFDVLWAVPGICAERRVMR